jgi:hypothetical protein
MADTDGPPRDEDGQAPARPDGRPAPSSSLSNPIVLIAMIIVVSVILLIGAAVVGMDRGQVLSAMARSEFARGLITYLFAVVTMGTAVVLVLAALLSTGDTVSEKRFQHGKEILSLLLGVFGTMVGFYFGAETASAPRSDAAILRMSSIDVTPATARADGRITVRAVVSGGTPPYRYGIAFGTDDPKPEEVVPTSGWIVKELPVSSQARAGEILVVRVAVSDSSGKRTDQTSQVAIVP